MRLDGARPQRTLGCTVQSTALTTRGRSRVAVPDRRRGDRHARGARADGRRVRAGLPAPGPPLRRGPRVLGDGLGLRALVRQRAHARLPAHRARRAPARGAGLRLGSGDGGRGRAHVRGRRRRHHRHQLRLPGAQGHEDRRGRLGARQPRRRGRDHARGRRGRRRPRDGQAAPRRAQRLARLPRPRPEAGRRRRGGDHAAPALRPADVHGPRRPRAHGRARRARRRPGDGLGRHHDARRRPGGARARPARAP